MKKISISEIVANRWLKISYFHHVSSPVWTTRNGTGWENPAKTRSARFAEDGASLHVRGSKLSSASRHRVEAWQTRLPHPEGHSLRAS